MSRHFPPLIVVQMMTIAVVATSLIPGVLSNTTTIVPVSPPGASTLCIFTPAMLRNGTAPPAGRCDGPLDRVIAKRQASLAHNGGCGLNHVAYSVDNDPYAPTVCGDCRPGTNFLEDNSCTFGEFCADDATCEDLQRHPLWRQPCPYHTDGHTSHGWCGTGLRCISNRCVECPEGLKNSVIGVVCHGDRWVRWIGIASSENISVAVNAPAMATNNPAQTATAVAVCLALVLIAAVYSVRLYRWYFNVDSRAVEGEAQDSFTNSEGSVDATYPAPQDYYDDRRRSSQRAATPAQARNAPSGPRGFSSTDVHTSRSPYPVSSRAQAYIPHSPFTSNNRSATQPSQPRQPTSPRQSTPSRGQPADSYGSYYPADASQIDRPPTSPIPHAHAQRRSSSPAQTARRSPSAASQPPEYG